MQTRRSNKPQFGAIGDLAALFSNCIILITKSVRSKKQIALLRRTLQLFVENRIGDISEVEAPAKRKELPENAQELLSLHLDATSYHKNSRVFVQRWLGSVHYVGELFVGKRPGAWRDSDLLGRDLWTRRVRDLLSELELPLDLDLTVVNGEGIGWQPPYAQDLDVLAAWATRRHFHRAGKCPDEGCETMGEFIRAQQSSDNYAEVPDPLRYAMFVPPNWKAPPLDPEGCRLDYMQDRY